MPNLFLTFLKINLLTSSGPASIGFTKQLVVPVMISEDKFFQITAITSGIPGSDAIQMAWQIGYAVRGIMGAVVAIIGALIPCIALVWLVMVGMRFINPTIMQKFFSGVNPALAVLLIVTALSLFKPTGNIRIILVLISAVLFLFKAPALLVLVLCGLIGVLL